MASQKPEARGREGKGLRGAPQRQGRTAAGRREEGEGREGKRSGRDVKDEREDR
jgi:hypothetical protein